MATSAASLAGQGLPRGAAEAVQMTSEEGERAAAAAERRLLCCCSRSRSLSPPPRALPPTVATRVATTRA